MLRNTRKACGNAVMPSAGPAQILRGLRDGAGWD
jgi:hypothetical protein